MPETIMLEDMEWMQPVFARYTAPLVIQDMILLERMPEPDEEYGLHDILSDLSLPESVAAIAACCLAMQNALDFEHPDAIALILEAERIMHESLYETGNYTLHDISLNEEDLAILHYGLCCVYEDVSWRGGILPAILNILKAQTQAHLDIARELLAQGDEGMEEADFAVPSMTMYHDAPAVPCYGQKPVNDNL